MVVINVNVASDKAVNEQRYQTLIYKCQSKDIRDVFGLTNKEYIDEIQKWNEDIVKYKACSENVWIKCFYPEQVIENIDVIKFENMN